jgi:hypothetical protein
MQPGYKLFKHIARLYRLFLLPQAEFVIIFAGVSRSLIKALLYFPYHRSALNRKIQPLILFGSPTLSQWLHNASAFDVPCNPSPLIKPWPRCSCETYCAAALLSLRRPLLGSQPPALCCGGFCGSHPCRLLIWLF